MTKFALLWLADRLGIWSIKYDSYDAFWVQIAILKHYKVWPYNHTNVYGD
jgi:hypothetical protein